MDTDMRPFYRVTIWQKRGGKKERITFYDYKEGSFLQMRQKAITHCRQWEAATPPGKLYEHTVEFIYRSGTLCRESSAMIYCNEYKQTVDGLDKEALYLSQHTDADLPMINLLEAIGIRTDTVLTFARQLKDLVLEEFPMIVKDLSELTVGTLPKRIANYERRRQGLLDEDKDEGVIGLEDLPF